MSATTRVTVSRTGRHRRPADLATTDLDPRPSAVAEEWSWRSATELRGTTTFWGTR